ncbi:unnamed protein product [Allacma fusca]|uniref:Uncharacterized protein n=1 Tax=Allacma fusca TaxID=39272 RepID=A0A8J2JD79_9HEXA|nr:unnamed protein product [Allacma fusca]
MIQNKNQSRIQNGKFEKLLKNLKEELEYVCYDDLEGVILMNLTKPKTAFICKEVDCKYYWSKFLEKSKPKRLLKFHHNFLSSDSLKTETFPYIFVSPISSYFRNIPLEHLKALVETGIYGLWSKWEPIRFRRYKNFKVEKLTNDAAVNDFQPLSFESSDIVVILYLALVGLAASKIIFWLEIICSCPCFIKKSPLSSSIDNSCYL